MRKRVAKKIWKACSKRRTGHKPRTFWRAVRKYRPGFIPWYRHFLDTNDTILCGDALWYRARTEPDEGGDYIAYSLAAMEPTP